MECLKVRIDSEMTVVQTVSALAEGNPGALSVCVDILKLGSVAPLLLIDSFGIYGSKIWMLYKDVCGQSVSGVIALLQAVQLGELSEDTLHHAIENYGAGIDVPAIEIAPGDTGI
jgi:hypothetical protein